MSRHLQLARRVPQPEAQEDDLAPDPGSWSRELFETAQARAIRPDPSDETADAPSYEFAIRILCPFCGSNDSTAATPCCSQGIDFSLAYSNDGSAAIADRHVPGRILGGALEVGWRSHQLLDAAQLLVALLASALIAALVSIATQRELANQRPEEPQTALVIQHQRPAVPQVVAAAAPSSTSVSETASPPAAEQPLQTHAAEPSTVVAALPAPPASVPLAKAEPVAAALAPKLSPPAVAAETAALAPAPLTAVDARQPDVESLERPVPVPAPDRWRALRRGMSRAAVQAILGHPRWIDHSRNIDFWLYEEDSIFGKAWVAFYDVGGPVSSWREP